MTQNTHRSEAFIKIKYSIMKSTNSGHLISCRKMIENADQKIPKEEIEILRKYLLTAWDDVNPVDRDFEMGSTTGFGESFADLFDTQLMRIKNNNQQ